jgi:steroid delta-isomerase-like uncharacterized protein
MNDDLALTRARDLWEAFNDRDVSSVADLVAEGFVNDAALPGTPTGPEGLGQVWRRLWNAFPDAHFTIDLLARDGDTVICVGTMEGVHEGELMGIPASGRRVRWRQCHLTAVDGEGRAVSHSAIRDDLGLFRQMGHAPG